MPSEASKKAVLRVARAAIAVSATLALAKGAAWLAGGSAALLASVVDSVIDLGISSCNFFVLRYAFRPADDDHRYGHGKAEGIAALAQAAFIAGSCAFVLLSAAQQFFKPVAPTAVGVSILVLGIGIVITIALTHFQKSIGKTTGSLATEADAAHYTGDVFLNGGVILSLLAGYYLGWLWLDPLAAVAVALWLLWTARGIGIKAIDMLLDREVEDALRTPLIQMVRDMPGVEGLHDFRTRRSGPKLIVSFDIEVDPALTLEAAHEISRRVEATILMKHPGSEIMIHLDPRGDITDSRHQKLKGFHGH